MTTEYRFTADSGEQITEVIRRHGGKAEPKEGGGKIEERIKADLRRCTAQQMRAIDEELQQLPRLPRPRPSSIEELFALGDALFSDPYVFA